MECCDTGLVPGSGGRECNVDAGSSMEMEMEYVTELASAQAYIDAKLVIIPEVSVKEVERKWKTVWKKCKLWQSIELKGSLKYLAIKIDNIQ